MTLTDRERTVLEILALKIRRATTAQLRALGLSTIRKLRTLEFIAPVNVCITRYDLDTPILSWMPRQDTPILSWMPGQDTPIFSAVSQRLKTRARKNPPAPVTLWCATGKTHGIFGGIAHPTKPHELPHDVAVTELFVQADDITRACWFGEDASPANTFATVPDVMLIRGGQVIRVLEIGGEYSPQKLKAFHRDMVKHDTPYEIW